MDASAGFDQRRLLPDPDFAAARLRPASNPRILLAATLRWPLAARLAIAFHKLGCPVQAWCPAGHPLEKTRAVERTYRYGVLTPQRSLHAAIRAAEPDLIIPCDNDAAIQLHQLYDSRPAACEVRNLIERSLGTPASCSRAGNRGELMELAASQGLRVPEAGRLSSTADLEAWSLRCGFPAVIKVDRSWGGLGVAVVRDIEQARRAFQTATHPSLMQALSHLVLRRDPSYLMKRLARKKPMVTVQNFIAGRPANRAVTCWQGEVLAGISVVALQTQSANGPATVVQAVENAEMAEAARRLVRSLGLSGFCGLDFVIEAATGDAYLIEVNPRATPISHLALGPGQDLPAALLARLKGEPTNIVSVSTGDSVMCAAVIAMFPGEWRRDSRSPYLRAAFHDVPWAEQELVRDCVALPWEERGLAARIRASLNPKRLPDVIPFPLTDSRSSRDEVGY